MTDKPIKQNAPPISEHVIAFDYGLKYIGSAVGNIKTMLAQPLQTISCKSGAADWQAIDKICSVWQPRGFVVGYPNTDSPSPLLKKLDIFIDRLHTRFDLPVDKSDEYLSSIEAYRILKLKRIAGETGRIVRSDIDKVAAALILESWFAIQKPQALNEN